MLRGLKIWFRILAAAVALAAPAAAQFWGGGGQWSLNDVPFSATPTFDLSKGSLQKITLSGNVTSSSLTNLTAGQIVMFRICQDATGEHSFVWPANVYGASAVPGAANACITSVFVSTETALYADSGPIGLLTLQPSTPTDYANPGGTGAGRTALIDSISCGTDTCGNKAAGLLGTGWSGWFPYIVDFFPSTQNPVAVYDFRSPRRISEIKFYYVRSGWNIPGNFRWQASSDGINWTDVSNTIQLHTGGTGNIWTLNASAAYRYYRWVGDGSICMDDYTITSAYIDFKIDAPAELITTIETSGRSRLLGQTNFGNSAIWTDDNKYDMGGAASGRPRTIYAGTSVVAPDVTVQNAAGTGQAYACFDATGKLVRSNTPCM